MGIINDLAKQCAGGNMSPTPGHCKWCDLDGKLRQIACNNGTFQVKVICPKCGGRLSGAIKHELLRLNNIDPANLPTQDDENAERPTYLYDTRPECLRCEDSVVVIAHRSECPVWICKGCAAELGTPDPRLFAATYRDNDFSRIPTVRQVQLDSMAMDEYYFSPEWRSIRDHKLWESGKRCQGCGRTDVTFDIHHTPPYPKRGQERPEDLVVFCRDCHDAIEEVKRRLKSA